MTRENHQVVTELIVDASGTVRVLRDVDTALGKTEQSFENTQAAANGLAATAPRAADVLKRGADAQAAAAAKMMGAYDASSKSVRQLYQVYGSAERAMNPVVAAEVKYQRQIAATQELLKRRVIDEQRAATTLSALREQQIVDLQRYKQAAENADQADRRHAAGNDNVARGRRQGLMFQSFDVGTTLAGGMNPALILAQQGPQIVQLYAGNGGVNAALKDMTSLLGGAARAAGPLGVVVLGLGVAFADFKSEIEESTGVAVTWGQVLSGTFTYIGKSIMTSLKPAIDWLAPYIQTSWGFIQEVAANIFNGVIGAVETAVNLIQFAIAGVAPAFEIYGKKAANAFVDAINWMYETAITPINKLIDAINWITQAGDSGLGHLTVPEDGLFKHLETDGIALEKYNEALKRFQEAQAGINGKDYLKEFKEGAQTEILKKNADAATESFKDQKKAIDDTVESLRFQVRTFGQSEGAIARARFEMEQFAAAKAKAAEDKTTFNENGKEAQQIREAGKEIEFLTGKLAGLDDALKRNQAIAEAWADLAFERGLVGLSDGEKEIRRKLEDLQLEYSSLEGQSLASEMRSDQMHEQARERMNEVREIASGMFSEMFSDPMADMDAFFDKLIDNLARIGQMNLESVFDQLFGVQGAAKGGGFDLGALGKQIGSFFSGKGGGVDTQQTASIARATVEPVRQANAALASSVSGTAKSIDGTMGNFMAGIRKIESGSYEGNYSATGQVMQKGMYKGDRAYGAYQVMGNNIAEWTKAALGESLTRTEFLNNKIAQDKTVAFQFQKSLDKFGNFSDVAAVHFSGQPLSNQRKGVDDGFNTVPSYMKKYDAAMAGLPDAIKTGAISGTETGSKSGIETGLKGIGSDFATNMTPSSGDPWADMRGAPAQGGAGGGGMFGGAGMQNLSIGLGAFGMGAQSGNPMMGGLSGAMSGMAGGPVGMLIGGAAGLLGGLFGKSRQRKAEQDAAKKALKEQMGAIEDMLDYATGTISGSITRSMREYRDEVGKAIELAGKAGDTALKKRLKASIGQLEDRLIKDFTDAYQGNIEGLNKGLGLDNPFQAGFKAVKDLRDELLAFVDDAKTAGLAFDAAGDSVLSATGKAGSAANSNNLNEYQARDLINRHQRGEDISQYSNATWGLSPFSGDKDNGGPNSVYMEKLFAAREAARAQALAKAKDAADGAAEAERKLSDARRAAVNQALSVLSGPTELTEIEQQMMELRGKAAALPPVLEDLGLTAAQAAEQIDKHLTKAIEKMAMDLINDLNASISELSGMGWLNDVIDAQETYQDRLKDSAALGIDASRANRELSLSLQEIVTGADLTKEQIAMLAGAFPDLAAAFGSVLPGGENDITAAMNAVEKARTDLRASYQKEASELETVIDRTKDFIANIKDFQKSLRVDNTLSPLSSYDRYLEAQKQFRDLSALAATGDEDAMGKLEGVSREYLDEARSYYASSEAYFDAFNEVQRILDSTLGKAEKQLSADEQQLAAIKDQVGKLVDIDDSVKSVADAIKALTAAQTASNAAFANQLGNVAVDRAYEQALGRPAEQAGLDYWKGQLNSGKDTVGGVVDKITNSNEAKIAQMYRDIMGRQGSTKEVSYWLTTGKSLDQIHADLSYAKKMGAFANGGYTGDLGRSDIAGVVHGREFVMNAEATSRWRPQFEAINAGRAAPTRNSDNGEAAQEIRELRAELKRLTAVVAAGAMQTTQAVERGTAVQADIASDMRKAASR